MVSVRRLLTVDVTTKYVASFRSGSPSFLEVHKLLNHTYNKYHCYCLKSSTCFITNIWLFISLSRLDKKIFCAVAHCF